jgi:glycosyltransferase involved in cell wall biosynthesis
VQTEALSGQQCPAGSTEPLVRDERPADTVYVLADLLIGGAQMGLVRLVALGFLSPARTHLLVLGRNDPEMLRAVLDRGPWAGLTLCERGPAPWRWAVGGLALTRLLARLRPRLVVLSLEPANLVGRFLRPFFPQSVFCSFEHNSRYRRRLYRLLFPLLSRGIDAVLYDSPATRAGVERFYGPRTRQWLEVPLFVFDPSVPSKRDYALGSVARILSVGRLVPAKDQALLLRVVAELRRRGFAVTCEIVG